MPFFDLKHQPSKTLFPGVTITTAWGEHLMMSFVLFDFAGATVPTHQHPHEQFGLLLEGEVDFTIDGERKHLVPGDYYTIPGNTPHMVETGPSGAVALDIFSPPRDDYLALPESPNA